MRAYVVELKELQGKVSSVTGEQEALVMKGEELALKGQYMPQLSWRCEKFLRISSRARRGV